MPNWCESELSVYGEEKEVKKFRAFAQGEDGVLDANKFIPYPKRFRLLDEKARLNNEKYEAAIKEATKHIPADMPSGEEKNRLWQEAVKTVPFEYMRDGYNQGGYDWCCSNWGTKWNFCNTEIRSYGSELHYTFDTAWSPITPVIAKMAARFPKLSFNYKYSEEGMGFMGRAIFENGACLQDACC